MVIAISHKLTVTVMDNTLSQPLRATYMYNEISRTSNNNAAHEPALAPFLNDILPFYPSVVFEFSVLPIIAYLAARRSRV